MKILESQMGPWSREDPGKRVSRDILWEYLDREEQEESQIDRKDPGEYQRIKRIAKKLAKKYVEAKRKPRRKLRV